MTNVDIFRDKSTEELKATLWDLREEQMHVRMQFAAGIPPTTKRMQPNNGLQKSIRRDIARVLTILTERKTKEMA